MKTILVQKWFAVFYKINKGLKPPCSGSFDFEQWCFSPLKNCKPHLFKYNKKTINWFYNPKIEVIRPIRVN